MPLMVQGGGIAPTSGRCVGLSRGDDGRKVVRLAIGLVNNMPDGAVRATERQFARLLGAASGTAEVTLHLFCLSEVRRGSAARGDMAARYGDGSALRAARLDGLIVTGAKPVAPSLAEEPYWDGLARLVDWAEHNTVSTIWSCLAAHAAVLHLDGIARRRLPEKRSGVFEGVTVAENGGRGALSAELLVPHSRWNDLAEGDLVSHGYRIASRSSAAGVDRFTKRWDSLFVFLQGHPEYDGDTLFREYRREAQRFLSGERDDLPSTPSGYFDGTTERAAAAFGRLAAMRREPSTWQAFPRDWACRPGVVGLWQAAAAQFYRDWLGLIAATVR